MTGTRIYQGWRYTFDVTRPAKERWQATREDQVLKTQTEAGIQKAIDASNEEVSRSYGAPIFRQTSDPFFAHT